MLKAERTITVATPQSLIGYGSCPRFNVVKRALVIGCAEGVWREVRLARDLCYFHTVYCVKLAGVHYKGGRFVWVGLHPEWMEDYKKQRAALGLHMMFETVAPPDKELGSAGRGKQIDRRVPYCYPGMNSSASSGGYAAKIALEDGHDRVVLAGVPMMADKGHFTRKKAWGQVSAFTKGFQESIPHWNGRVRSMSGWSAKLLGEPDPAWLNGETPQPIR